jgi:hypothetical protein
MRAVRLFAIIAGLVLALLAFADPGRPAFAGLYLLVGGLGLIAWGGYA